MRSWQKNFRSSVTPSGVAINLIFQTQLFNFAKRVDGKLATIYSPRQDYFLRILNRSVNAR
jgi:hypothetical protein